MARIRTIKPEFWKHEQLGRLSFGARLTFVGLISMADDEGRGRSDPEWLWGQLHSYVHPNTKRTWVGILSELRRVRDDRGPLIVFYKVAGAAYYWIPGFKRQQRIDEPSPSKFPPPPDSGNVPVEALDCSSLERRGGERKGRDQGSGRGEEEIPPSGSASPGNLDPIEAPPMVAPAESGENHAEDLEVAETVSRYAAWSHPPPEKKAEGVRELRALGLSHEYIRNGSQVNKPADAGFWDIVKALKAAHQKGRNGRAKVPTEILSQPLAPAEKPAVLQERREDVHRRQDEARARCDQMLEAMSPAERDQFFADAEASAEAAKLKPGPIREAYIKAEVRKRVAKQYAIEGL